MPSLIQLPQIKPINASLFDVPQERKVIHRQTLNIENKALFDIELSFEKIHFYIIARRTIQNASPRGLRDHGGLKDQLHQKKLFIKQLWLSQAKQLLKVFDVNMTAMVNGLIKINSELAIDFSFIDKILLNMVGIKKDKLIQALR